MYVNANSSLAIVMVTAPAVFTEEQELLVDKRSIETIGQSFTSLLVILTTFSGIILARIATQRLCTERSPITRYLVEFPLIVLPSVLFVTVAESFVVHFVSLMIVLSVWYILRTQALSRAKSRTQFDLGSRPFALTIVRALTHLITAVCILAIDFNSFHRPYRKSRRYGGQLMDTGIGLFVVIMGLVSRRTRNRKDLRRSILRSALPLILLGIGRTVAIISIGYGQDEHEYGRHLNAFFTLGLTKLLGSVISLFARTDLQLLPLALNIVVCHQLGLTFGGISEYVMDDDLARSTVLSANREGLFSLPGFVAIYLLSICFSRWLVSKTILSYDELIGKLRGVLGLALLSWLVTVGCTLVVGISRVTCNMGYVFWMFGITITMVGLAIFVFDLIITHDSPIVETDKLEKGSLIKTADAGDTSRDKGGLYVICESLNMNGLIFFLLANVLTGGVNIFLKPQNRSSCESILILIVYMFLVSFTVVQLYKRRIRIA